MKYPAMRGTVKYRVEVPQLSGGTNMADAAQRVEDNQLTDSLNVWWHDNLLQTRPGLTRGSEIFSYTWKKHTVQPVNEQETFLLHWQETETGKWVFYPEMISAREQPSYERHGTGRCTIQTDQPGGYMVRAPKGAGTDWYAFTTGGIRQHEMEDGDPGLDGWKPVTELYVPTVLVNGKGNASADGMTGTLFEGYNLLTAQFKAKFTTDGKSVSFKMPTELIPGAALTVSINLPCGENGASKTYTIVLDTPIYNDVEGTVSMYNHLILPPEAVGGTSEMYSEVYCALWATQNGVIYAETSAKLTGSDEHKQVYLAASIANNLTVTAYSAGWSKEDSDKILRMKRCCWFGGDRSGLAGGTRLFVCGNPEYPNLVHWSDVNKPLYFPENNYAYVGDSSQKVTGFGKQGDLLLIFKQSEIYAAQYVAGQSYTAEDVENGKVVDVAAYAAQFPLTPIHPTVGCDCPDTIRLVNNRLCWADSRGYIYMLPTVNQYNERVVREIGGNIRRALTGHTKAEWESAGACEYCGHYMLTVGKRAYLLETNNSSFSSYTYYAKETSAQRLLPWYIWEFPQAIAAVAGDRDTVKLAAGAYVYRLSGKTDDGEPIHSRFVTKLFDFGRSQAGKAIHQLYITMADAGGRVRVSYLTEDYTAEDAYLLEANGDEQPNTAGYFKPFRLSPNLHRIREFGIRCESEGTMAVSGISIDYTIQGVVR